jgi:hypothetical protein
MRITAISLKRRPDRWTACEAHLRAVLPEALHECLDMFEGTDAAACVLPGTPPGEPTAAAFEAAHGCTLYRDWPITECADVRRCFPRLDAACATDDEAWIGYERTMAAAWRPDRARLYVDFFNRHLALGEMGASLSHYRVAERAHAERLALQVVFEDDARPTASALPALLDEVGQLEAAGVGWDLIYLHSAAYGRRTEPPLELPTGCTALRHAGHRKVCHAYALSARGAAKLASCGYRTSLLPYDDFLPALHAGHPRQDVMALPCVRAARGEAGADAAAGPDAGGPPTEGFVAFTFDDDAALCTVPPKAESSATADSDSKAGKGSSVLFGDLGTDVDTEAGEEVR